MRDARLLLWLRWRAARSSLSYWMGVAGYDDADQSRVNQLYLVYLLVLGIGWCVLMWSLLANQAAQINVLLSPAQRMLLHGSLPWAAVFAYGAVLVYAISASPVRLSLADVAYLSSAPHMRAVITCLAFMHALARPLVGAMILAPLVAVLFVPPTAAAIRWETALVGPLVVGVIWAWAWAAGVLRLTLRPGDQRGPVRLGIVAAALLGGGVTAWGSLLFLDSSAGALAPLPVLLLGVALLVPCGALLWLSRSVNMLTVASDSVRAGQLRARIALAATYPELAQRWRTQDQLATQGPRRHLPAAHGWRSILARSFLAYVRRPALGMTGIVWALVVVQSGVWVLATHPGLSVVMPWLTLAALVVPRGLVALFWKDVATPFARQFLPLNNLHLLLIHAIVPCSILIGGSICINVFLAASFVTVLYGVLIALVVVLCVGASALRITPWHGRVPYALLVGPSLGSMLGLDALFGSAPLTVAGALVVIGTLAVLLKRSAWNNGW